MLEKTTRLNMLYDFYAPLLTNKQIEYMELYYLEDYSLGEIANVNEVSRQAVYDNIRRTEKVLEMYEEKLLLYDKFLKKQQVVERLRSSILSDVDKEELLRLVKQLENID